jgi:hypothetical protein
MPIADCILLLVVGAIPLLVLEMLQAVRRDQPQRETDQDEHAKED